MDDQEKLIDQQGKLIEGLASLFAIMICELELSEEELKNHRELGTDPHELVKMVMAEKNDKIKLLQEKLNLPR